ncbi:MULTISPECIES: carbon starvation CstA family protein [unclassified Lysobacter]|uniref:carbon starvation CstA family protein n=1 Tax=unclassified Lysobacter TaxID=2635362 RepID=UPI0006F510B5|nr:MULTISPECIES: carbon starvation CstA family protein [unclassified Lysobacter]KQZ60026.1 carbon starvation protein A [Lysobacter sp. Root559]KRC38474.1 carbon starvation protein A [Lysobacter sp. Root76]KRD71329.1 carbon starvation protein A [Lysobacter sp. Root96]
MKGLSWLGWGLMAVLAAFCLGTVALNRGESISAMWLVVAAVSTFTIAYRFYGRYIAQRALMVDPSRATPAWRRNDGLDYVPTEKSVVFGHHFAAIAGAGPLVGPVLAAQMGYLPGTLWILFGVVLAGAVQDMLVLFFSTRRDGRSLGEMIRAEMGPAAGVISMIGILMIMVILLAVLALVVVKALAESPWGTFTVAMTIPIAILMGVYLRYFRAGRILEVSIIGFALLLLAIWLGGRVAADPTWSAVFHLKGTTLAWLMIGYGFIASVLPVWFLLAPRDYLSTFLKIGTVLVLALAIVIAAPQLQMPAMTQFVDGTGPVFSGKLFPFLFITIACGAVSGFHSLISSGTTPKMISSEGDIRLVGYGGMLMEAFVAIMALIAACVLQPGVYFAMNAPGALIGTTAESAALAISNWGFVITPDVLTATAKEIGETTILSRTGGAPTLAVGMAQILHGLIPGEGMMAFWYHYAILFEALFILTTIDAGTRVARFMIQELVGLAYAPFQRTDSWVANIASTLLAVSMWGYFLYQGVVDPLGGINTLWPLFGIANQMLAGLALVFCCVVMVKMKREKYLWIPLIPTVWLLICTLTAGWQKLFDPNPKIGFIANARKFADAAARGEVLAPAKSVEEMQRVVFNNYLDAGLTALFVAVVIATVFFGLRAAFAARRNAAATARESDYVALESLAR